MAAATDVDLVDDLDIDIDDFDVIQAMEDLLAHDEFRGGGAYYSAIFSDADIVSHCRHGCEDGDGDSGAAAACAWLMAGLGDDDCGDGAEEEEAGSSPANSGVTDDGPLALAAVDDDHAEAMSAYVAKLERFLLEDDDDDAPCGEQADGLLGVVDDYFAGDQLLATAEVVPGLPAAGGAGRTDGEEKEEEEENGDGGGGDVLAAREDEQSASRKRARNKIKGTPWRELELMNLMLMPLTQIQVPATRLGHQLRLLSCGACRMWPSGLIA